MKSRQFEMRHIITCILLITIITLIIVPGNAQAAGAQEAPESAFELASESTAALTSFGKVSPANGATNQATTVTLKWSSAGENPYGFNQYYKYCYHTAGANCNFLGTLTTTQYEVTGLTTGITYYWQIQVINCKDSTCTGKEKTEADNGQEWSFSTLGTNPPGAFSKSLPADNDLNIASRVLSWQGSTGATSYQVCYTPNINDTNCTYLGAWKDVGNVTTYTIPNDSKFIWGNRYYWQIKASRSGGTTIANNGTWWSFTTANLVGKVTLISPDGVLNVSTPTYRWNELSGATWYYLWVIGPGGTTVLAQWYEAPSICSAGTCAVTPSITLGAGDHNWRIQAWNSTGYGPLSNALYFNTPIPTPPSAATLITPSGNIGTNYTPTYTWNEVIGSTWYYLKVNGPSGSVIQQWYTSAQANCNGTTCSVTPAMTLPGGAHTWWIQTWNSAGEGPWSAGKSFNTFLVGAATLVSPTGNIGTNYSPNFVWNEVSGATWYYLWVNGPSGNVIQQWYTSAQANCNGTTCSVTPAITLAGGVQTWWIQSWNSAGSGPWSTGMVFSTTIPTVPGAATLITPSGNNGTNYTPTYTWNEVTGATWYYLWVNGPNGNVIQQWYTSAQANCNGTTCSVAPATILGGGDHTWWVQTWNPAGYGLWSNGMTFSTTIIPLPGAATLVSPNGISGSNPPVYTWNKVADATWYYLWVNDSSGNIFKQWYETSSICGASTCTVTAPAALSTGSYSFWARTWNSTGYGPWSSNMDFSIP